MEINAHLVRDLREKTGAPVMDCKKALQEVDGDIDKAVDCLREKGLKASLGKAGRSAQEGLIDAYIHPGNKIGVMVEVNCETDFVARTDEFRELAHHLAMQVAAMNPQVISREEAPQTSEVEPQTACLLLQPYIKDTSKTVQDVINETIAKVGENIKVSRFARFSLAE